MGELAGIDMNAVRERFEAAFPEFTKEYRQTVNHWSSFYNELGGAVAAHRDTTVEIFDQHGEKLNGIDREWLIRPSADSVRADGDGLGPHAHALDRLSLEPDASGTSADERLREAILASEGDLNPADVLNMAVQAAGGDYFEGLVTAHNLLKNIAATERGQYDGPQASEDLAIKDQLMSVLPSQADSGDFMGSWYHIFSVGVIDAVGTPILGQIGARVENQDITHGYDPYENAVNVLAASAFAGGTMAHGLRSFPE